MSLTLEDLGFEFDDSALNDVETQANNGIIKPDTVIVDTPVLINDFLKDIVDGLKNLFQSNLENLAADFDEWFTQKATDLKNEIEETLSLDPDTVYNIQVTHAQEADNSTKFNNKTYSEMVSDIYTNYISTATVANSLKFNGKTMDDYDNYIKTELKPLASDTEKAFGYDFDSLKATILADVSTSGGGVDLSTVQNNVENVWTAYKAKDSEKFDGKTSTDWQTNIIPNIKVNNAVNADKINNVDYDTLIESIDTMIQNHLSTSISSDNTDLINIIKNVKVTNASQADSAVNATKFDGNTSDDWKSIIIPTVKVNNASHADNSDKLGGITADGWQSKLDTLQSTIQTKVETEWTAYKAQTVLKINGIDVDKFDDHINDLISDALSGINDLNVDAKRFDGKTSEEWQTDIIPNIKVNNAAHADEADIADTATNAAFARFLS